MNIIKESVKYYAATKFATRWNAAPRSLSRHRPVTSVITENLFSRHYVTNISLTFQSRILIANSVLASRT